MCLELSNAENFNGYNWARPLAHCALALGRDLGPACGRMSAYQARLVSVVWCGQQVLSFRLHLLQICRTPRCLTLKPRLPAHQTPLRGTSQVGVVRLASMMFFRSAHIVIEKLALKAFCRVLLWHVEGSLCATR